jgi:DNA-binding NarL/FixJ family response regulator
VAGTALTARETEVVRLVAEGLTNSEIAARLHLSTRTVQSHVKAALKKTGRANRVQLAVYAVRAGLVPMEYPDSTGGSANPPGGG